MNPAQFQKALEQLRGWRQYAFLLSLAERAFPNFVLYAESQGLKTPAVMRVILDQAWHMLVERDHDIDPYRLLTRLETLVPDPEMQDSYGAYPAADMGFLLESALLCRVNAEKLRGPEGAARAMNTVMGFLEVSEGEGLDDNELVRLFDHHELMRVERAFQRELVVMLRRQRAPDAEFVRELRELAANGGVSNLGIALDDEDVGEDV